MRKLYLFVSIMLLHIFVLSTGARCADADNGPDSRQPLEFKHLPVTKDADGDFLADEFENALIDAYAPLFVFHPAETCWPSNVNHHLKKCVRVRAFERRKTAKEQYADIDAPKYKTWEDVVQFCDNQYTSNDKRFEDVYIALPLDKTALEPGKKLPSCPNGDFRVERAHGETKSISDVYRARVMIPVYRPVKLNVEFIDEEGRSHKGTCSLDVFAGSRAIPDSIESDSFALYCNGTTLKATLKVKSGIRSALGLDAHDTPMPNGPVFDWGKVEAKLKLTGEEVSAGFVARHASARGKWLEGGKARAAYFTVGDSAKLKCDVEAAKQIWGTGIPNPEGGAEIYAHVYPVASFIVIQYWVFYGYSDFNGDRHEGDWGDRIEVIVYRDTPTASEGVSQGNTPVGAIPAYRQGGNFTQNMVAMVVYNGSCGKQVFYRSADDPGVITQSRDTSAKLSSDFIATKLKWANGQSQFVDNGTHPIAYVARGSHQMYAKGGRHKRKPSYGRVKNLKSRAAKIIDKASSKSYGVDKCAKDANSKNVLRTNSSVYALPSIKGSAFTGSAIYGSGGNTVTLGGSDASIRIVNVGELTASKRQTLMRYDGKTFKELKKCWSQFLPKESASQKKEREKVREAMEKVLEEPVKETLKEMDGGEKDNSDGKEKTKKKEKSSTNLKQSAEEKVKAVRSKLWHKIVDAKDAARKITPKALDDELNQTALEIIQDKVGVKKVEPLLMLSNTKPMAGGEFIDYSGRWGRISYSTWNDDLVRQQNRYFLNYEMPDDERMKLLRTWNGCGPVGPTGARPHLYIADFYRDYDSVAECLMVHGMDVSL